VSQAGIISTTSGPVPPAVPTSFVTDVNSPAIPVANVLNALGGDTTADNANGIRTDGSSGSNTLTVQLTNRLQGTVSTSGAVTGDLITFALGATPGTYKFTFNIAGFNASTPAGLGYDIDASVRTDGATATVISTPDGDEDEDAALINADWDVIGSGNSVILRVTGVAGLDINWSSVGYYVLVN
jgi:hypothetical protein